MRFYLPGWVNLLSQSKSEKTRRYIVGVKSRLRADADKDLRLFRQRFGNE